MKYIIAALALIICTVYVAGHLASDGSQVAFADPAVPAQCTMTIDNVIEVGAADPYQVVGTADNDLIVSAGGVHLLNSLGGNDCLVSLDTATITYYHAGAGNDVIVGGSGVDIMLYSNMQLGDDYADLGANIGGNDRADDSKGHNVCLNYESGSCRP